MGWDYLIVGAGLTGATCARLLADQGKTCLVIDKRKHIGGNCYDKMDEDGILTHIYGPHHFRTDHQKVIDFLSRFTEWERSEYTARSLVNGTLYYFPISQLTFDQFVGRYSTREEMVKYFESVRKNGNPENSEELVVSQVGQEMFEMFYAGYTQKMWGRPARELDPAVCGRIPVYYERDNRYSQQRFQGVPRKGYAALFTKMLSDPKIDVLLQCDASLARKHFSYKRTIYTGMIDAYYDYRFGRLPYRSLNFHSGPKQEKRQQVACQISYSGMEFPYTRSIEIKHITRQDIPYTRVIWEFPAAYNGKNEPYYPIPALDTHNLYQKYAELAQAEDKVIFAGRLGFYRYLNMDQAVLEAMAVVEKLGADQ